MVMQVLTQQRARQSGMTHMAQAVRQAAKCQCAPLHLSHGCNLPILSRVPPELWVGGLPGAKATAPLLRAPRDPVYWGAVAAKPFLTSQNTWRCPTSS